MKAKDKISYNYRKQVDELFPNQANPGFLDPLKQVELEEIWREISNELDIDEVWNDISSDLDVVMPVNSGSGMIVKYIAVVLIILIGMVTVKMALLDSGINQQDLLTENKPNKQVAELVTKNNLRDSNTGEQVEGDISPALRSSLDKTGDAIKPTPPVRNMTGLTQEIPMHVSNEAISEVSGASGMADSNLVVFMYETPGERINIMLPLTPIDTKQTEVLPEIYFDSFKMLENFHAAGYSLPLTDKRRVSAGLTIFFRNSWLLNRETLDGLKSETLNSTEIVFFPDAALCLNYSLNKSWLFQAEGFLYSNTGQEYYDYIYGHYSKKKITLKYSTIALSVKYKLSGKKRFLHRSSINLLAGGYLSVLHYADQKINTDSKNIESQYEKLDFGVRLGSEIEVPIFDHLSLAPGLFLSIGIPNIYKGDSNISGSLKTTHNASAGFSLAFYYHFN